MKTKFYERIMYIFGSLFLICFVEIFFLSPLFDPIVTYIALIFWMAIWVGCIIICEILIRKQKKIREENENS